MTLSEKYGINKRIQLREIEVGHIAIVKKIKSRIIRKDALKVIEIGEELKAKNKLEKLSLICSTNICSKSKQLLSDKGIQLIIEELE